MMSRERELLERAYQYIPMSSITSEEIRDYLMSTKPENIDTSEERVRESDISEAEPVAWRRYNPVHSTIQDELEENNNGTPIYLHPAPRKEFVRLSDEEMRNVYAAWMLDVRTDMYAFARAIEDALEEKNR